MHGTLGRYTLVRPLAQGGMGDVWVARVTGAAGFTRPAVIKRVRPELKGRGDAVGMFLDEARLSAQLNHPHIVQVFDLGETDDGFYMAMEYVEGTHLGRLVRAAVVREEPLPLEVSVFIAARVAEALHYAHHARNLQTGEALQVVHRDVSPSNILLSVGGDVKLTDFGVAKARTQQVKTAMGYVKGKVAYLSPEQVELKKVDGRSDVFSLGIVLWECLARMRLYKESDEFVAMNRIVEEPPPPPSRYNPAIPDEVEALVLRALEKNPDDRYPTAGSFQDALDGWLRDRGVFHGRQALGGVMRRFAQDLGLDQADQETEQVRGRAGPAGAAGVEAPAPSFAPAPTPAPADAETRAPPDEPPPAPRKAPRPRRPAAETRTPPPAPRPATAAGPAGAPAAEATEARGAGRGDGATTQPIGRPPSGSGEERTWESDAAIPRFQTPFVGRHAELSHLARQLKEGERFLNVVGPPGIGKTRLVAELARRLFDPTGDDEGAGGALLGCAYLSLVDTVGFDEVCERLARALAVPLELGHNSADAIIQLAGSLRERGAVLVVIDGADGAVSAVDEVAGAILASAPEVRLIVTTRKPLPGEEVSLLRLKPLRQEAPEEATSTPRPHDVGFEAVDLFVQRVRTLRPDYVLTEEDAATVRTIVARLGGNPLAIEIAAGQVAGVDPAALLDKLEAPEEGPGWTDDSVTLALHTGLAALAADEEQVLVQSAIFPSRIPPEAARAVLVVNGPRSVDELLEKLVQRSLLKRVVLERQGIRYEGYLLDSEVRERAQERLGTWAGRTALEERFERYYLDLGEELAAAATGPLGVQARAALASELDNLRAVARRTLRHEPGQTSADRAVRAALVLDAHYATAGPTTQHLSVLDAAFEQLSSFEDTEPRLAARLWMARGQARFFRGLAEDAAHDLTEACERARAIADPSLEASALYLLAEPLRALGRPERVRPVLEQALGLARQAADLRTEGLVLGSLGALRLDEGEPSLAEPLLQLAIERLADTGDLRAEAVHTGHLARVARALGNDAGALALAARAIDRMKALGDRRGEAEVTGELGDLYAAAGDRALADDLYRRALRLAREVGDARREALLLAALGASAAAQDRVGQARLDLDAAEALLVSVGLTDLLGVVDLCRGQLDLAEARACQHANDVEGAWRHVARAEQRLAAAAQGPARAAAERLRRALAAAHGA